MLSALEKFGLATGFVTEELAMPSNTFCSQSQSEEDHYLDHGHGVNHLRVRENHGHSHCHGMDHHHGIHHRVGQPVAPLPKQNYKHVVASSASASASSSAWRPFSSGSHHAHQQQSEANAARRKLVLAITEDDTCFREFQKQLRQRRHYTHASVLQAIFNGDNNTNDSNRNRYGEKGASSIKDKPLMRRMARIVQNRGVTVTKEKMIEHKIPLNCSDGSGNHYYNYKKFMGDGISENATALLAGLRNLVTQHHPHKKDNGNGNNPPDVEQNRDRVLMRRSSLYRSQQQVLPSSPTFSSRRNDNGSGRTMNHSNPIQAMMATSAKLSKSVRSLEAFTKFRSKCDKYKRRVAQPNYTLPSQS
jgi:hypothetical protein